MGEKTGVTRREETLARGRRTFGRVWAHTRETDAPTYHEVVLAAEVGGPKAVLNDESLWQRWRNNGVSLCLGNRQARGASSTYQSAAKNAVAVLARALRDVARHACGVGRHEQAHRRQHGSSMQDARKYKM